MPKLEGNQTKNTEPYAHHLNVLKYKIKIFALHSITYEKQNLAETKFNIKARWKYVIFTL